MTYDCIVIGAGAMGTATAYHLAKRGSKVLCLDEHGIPNHLGSSHGNTRAIRKAYFEHPDYVPLLERSYELWRELEEVTGNKLMHLVGGLYIGPEDCELVQGSLTSAKKYGLAHEMLDFSEMRGRYPQFHLPQDFVAFFESDGGFLLPELCVATHAAQAMEHGAEIHGQEPVLEWRSQSNGVEVKTSWGTYEAGQLILCAGAWTSKLLAQMNVPLSVSRQVTGWVWPRKPEMFQMSNFPVSGIQNRDGTFFYTFPMQLDMPGLKIARHRQGQEADPDRVDRAMRPGDEEHFMPLVQDYLRDGQGPLLNFSVCMYTNTPDGHFVIDRHPEHDNVLFAAGFSGHGFKFAPVIGEALADFAEKGETSLPIGFLSMQRFV